MNLWPLILLLGTCFPHWTTASPVRNVTYDLSHGILKKVPATNIRRINLSHLLIKFITANAFNDLDEVETLDLSNNDLVALPPLVFSKMTKLKELSLFNNRISSFNNTFVGLTNLKLLNIAKNPIESLKRGDFFGLTKSVKIMVRSTQLSKISSGIFKKPSVGVLTKNEETALSRGEDREYDLFHYRFRINITNGLFESIELGGAGDPTTYAVFHYKPPPVVHLSESRINGFKDKWFKVIDSFYNEIDLSFNEIVELSPELFNDLPLAIRRIDLSHNLITALKKNDRIANITIGLDLSGNRISTIENGAFGKLNLLTLSLQKNLLKSTAFARTLPSAIRILRLDENKISEVPRKSFYGLENLQFLTIIRNQVKNIEPGTFRDQKNLEKIKLMNNEIRELKSGLFRGLARLEHIDLGNNQIKKISSNLFQGYHHNPTKFNLSLNDNKIKIIENGAFSYMNLSALSLHGNKFRDYSIGTGTFDRSHISSIRLASHGLTRFNGEWFRGVSGLKSIRLSSPLVPGIKKGFAKHMQNVTTLHLTIKELKLENGALFGLSTEEEVEIFLGRGTLIKFIRGGLFDDL